MTCSISRIRRVGSDGGERSGMRGTVPVLVKDLCLSERPYTIYSSTPVFWHIFSWDAYHTIPMCFLATVARDHTKANWTRLHRCSSGGVLGDAFVQDRVYSPSQPELTVHQLSDGYEGRNPSRVTRADRICFFWLASNNRHNLLPGIVLCLCSSAG